LIPDKVLPYHPKPNADKQKDDQILAKVWHALRLPLFRFLSKGLVDCFEGSQDFHAVDISDRWDQSKVVGPSISYTNRLDYLKNQVDENPDHKYGPLFEGCRARVHKQMSVIIFNLFPT
jgi:hypothetical protein